MLKYEFLNKVVNGYIKKDLENLKSCLPKKPGEEGNNNFTIALCILSYMEYLGSFFSLNDFDFTKNVTEYIKNCFKFPADYHPILLKDLFRNGLAHDYFARGGISRDGNRPAMYKNYQNKAILDADTLLEDFLTSLDKFAQALTDYNYVERMKIADNKINLFETRHASEINSLTSLARMSVSTSGATIYPGPGPKTTTTP